MIARSLLFISAAAAFGLSPYATRLGPVLGSALLVVLGVMLALAASGTANAMAAATGAVGAFLGGVLVTVSPAVAGAALVGLCYAERTVRVRGAVARTVHTGMALAGGALAGAAAHQFTGAGVTVQLVVLVVAAVLVSLPQLVEADDPLAHTLDELADEVPVDVAVKLREGAELSRTVEADMLDRKSRKLAQQTWRALLNLAHSRVRLERARQKRPSATHGDAVRNRIDERIAEHVEALARMYTAVDEVKAAEASLEDGALRTVENNNESMEQMSKAIVEEV
jgi:MFS family permease